MPTIRDIAVCIRRWDFSETSQTVSLFTREHGVLRGLAKGAKRRRGSFSGGLDVLTRGQIVAIVKTERELATLTDWHLEEVFWAVRQHLAANRAGLYMADLIHHMLTGHDPHAALFDHFVSALRAVEDAEGIEGAVLSFHWALLRETGYQPELERDAETGAALAGGEATLAFSARAGGVVADTGGSDRWRVRAETVRLIRAAARGTAEQKVSPEAQRRANRLLAAYCRELIGSEPNAMRWAFPDLATALGEGTGKSAPGSTQAHIRQPNGR